MGVPPEPNTLIDPNEKSESFAELGTWTAVNEKFDTSADPNGLSTSKQPVPASLVAPQLVTVAPPRLQTAVFSATAVSVPKVVPLMVSLAISLGSPNSPPL